MLAKSLIDQTNVSIVLLHCHSSPHLGRSIYCAFGILDESRNLEQALNNVAIASFEGSILQHQRIEQSIANQLDINGRVVADALNLAQIQQCQIDLVLDDLIV